MQTIAEYERRLRMGSFKPSDYTIKNALKEVARYDGIYVGDNYVTKDHGNYVSR